MEYKNGGCNEINNGMLVSSKSRFSQPFFPNNFHKILKSLSKITKYKSGSLKGEHDQKKSHLYIIHNIC